MDAIDDELHPNLLNQNSVPLPLSVLLQFDKIVSEVWRPAEWVDSLYPDGNPKTCKPVRSEMCAPRYWT